MSNSVAATAKRFTKSLPTAGPMESVPEALLQIARQHAAPRANLHREALLYHDSLRRVHCNQSPAGWYESQRPDLFLETLAAHDLVVVQHTLGGASKRRHIVLYRLTPEGAELLGTQIMHGEEPMSEMSFKVGQEVIFEEQLVTILEIGDKGRISIRLNAKDRPIWVDANQLTPMPVRDAAPPITPPAPIPAQLLKLAGNDEAAARQLSDLLNDILRTGDWHLVPGAVHDTTSATAFKRVRCELLRQHKLLERRYTGSGYEYRWTPACADLMNLPHPYADPTPTPQACHPDLFALAKRLNPDANTPDGITDEYIGTLKIAHGDSTQRAWTPIGPRQRRLHFAEQLEQGGFVLLRNHKPGVCAEWQITAAGSQAIGWEHPAIPQPVEEPLADLIEDDPILAQAEAIIDAAPRPAVEVKTLTQDIGKPERIVRADEELSCYLSEDWQPLHTQIINDSSGIVRFIMLQRRNHTDSSARSTQHAARRFIEPIGPAIEYRPGPMVESIILDGVDATLNNLDAAVVDRFQQALAQAMTTLPARTLIPAVTSEVK